jgi:hypothetical protein
MSAAKFAASESDTAARLTTLSASASCKKPQPSRQISASESWCIGPAVSSQKAKEMPGDPNRCREHARRCAEIARHTASPEVRDHFTSLEQSWLRLAAEIESGQKLLDLIGEISRDLVPIAEAAE